MYPFFHGLRRFSSFPHSGNTHLLLSSSSSVRPTDRARTIPLLPSSIIRPLRGTCSDSSSPSLPLPQLPYAVTAQRNPSEETCSVDCAQTPLYERGRTRQRQQQHCSSVIAILQPQAPSLPPGVTNLLPPRPPLHNDLSSSCDGLTDLAYTSFERSLAGRKSILFHLVTEAQ